MCGSGANNDNIQWFPCWRHCAIEFEIFSKTLGTVIMPILQVRRPVLGRTYMNQDLNPGNVSPDPELPALLLNKGYGTWSVTAWLWCVTTPKSRISLHLVASVNMDMRVRIRGKGWDQGLSWWVSISSQFLNKNKLIFLHQALTEAFVISENSGCMLDTDREEMQMTGVEDAWIFPLGWDRLKGVVSKKSEIWLVGLSLCPASH